MENAAALVEDRPTFFQRLLPGFTLFIAAPLVAELLPGATRFGAIFVFPIEMCIWGGGALWIRELVRRRGLGWVSMLCLGLVLALAEECVIQQTSLAPLVIQLKGQVYARASGVNYVYLVWALIYEAVFVVFLPVLITELLFPARRAQPWMNLAGTIVTLILFVPASLLAWYAWTHIARIRVFHVPAFDPPLGHVLIALAAMLVLVLLAFGPARHWGREAPLEPWSPWLLGLGSALWSVLVFGLSLLAFGIAPDVPPAAAVGGGVALAAVAIALVPRFAAHPAWRDLHGFGLFAGALSGMMGAMFLAFIGATPADLWFKLVTDALALLWLVWFGLKLRGRQPSAHTAV
jgi:hypothetical protein